MFGKLSLVVVGLGVQDTASRKGKTGTKQWIVLFIFLSFKRIVRNIISRIFIDLLKSSLLRN